VHVIPLIISLVALIVSVLSYFSTNTKKESAKLYVYEGSYDLKEKFSVDMKMAFINNGDMDALISDVWLTVEDGCSVKYGNRISPIQNTPLLSSKGEISVGRYQFETSSPAEGSYNVCLYVEAVSGILGMKEQLVGEHEINVIEQRGKKDIPLGDPNAWNKVYTVFDKKKFYFW